MRQGTTCLLAVVDNVTDDMLRMPSALPGWTRAHVVGHLARNAEALTRLANWADSGVETPMYTSREQRAVEIEEAANLSGTVLRSVRKGQLSSRPAETLRSGPNLAAPRAARAAGLGHRPGR